MSLAVSHTLFPNEVLESKLTDLLNTKLGVRSLMTIDNSLTEAPGMIKKINVYNYTGQVEKLAKGEGNTASGVVSYTTKQYTVELSQQMFQYYDEDVMMDPTVVDMGMAGASTLMVNDLNKKFFDELGKASLKATYATTLNYDTIVDAIQLMNLEDESGLFLIIGTDLKAQIRKDPDFKSAQLGEILFNGQIGTISGVPVIVSKLTPKGEAFLATKEAITLFVKKDSEVEQERQANERLNSVFMRKVHLVALTDATKVVHIKAAGKAAQA